MVKWLWKPKAKRKKERCGLCRSRYTHSLARSLTSTDTHTHARILTGLNWTGKGIVAPCWECARASPSPSPSSFSNNNMLVIFVLFICVFKLNRWEKFFLYTNEQAQMIHRFLSTRNDSVSAFWRYEIFEQRNNTVFSLAQNISHRCQCDDDNFMRMIIDSAKFCQQNALHCTL